MSRLVTGLLASVITVAATIAQAPAVKLSGTITTAAREPVTGAVVALLTETGALLNAPALRQVLPVSTPEGRFEWPEVPAGAYRVVVASAEALKDWPAETTVRRFHPQGFPITLKPDQGPVQMQMVVNVGPPPNHDITLSKVSVSMTMAIGGAGGPPPGAPPRPPGSTTGPPRNRTGPSTISGVLTSEDGRPLAGIQVHAARRLTPAAPATSGYQSIGPPDATDANGAYRIAGLQPGSYVVAAVPWIFDVRRFLESSARSIPAETEASGQRIALWTTYFPGVTSPRTARLVTIEPGETRGIDFVVRRERVSTLTVQLGQPGTLVRGDTPANLMPASVADQFGSQNGLRCVPHAVGTCTFADIQPGDYVFTYLAESGWVREPVTVALPTTSVTFPPKPYMTVSGRVDLRTTRLPGGPETLTTLMVALSPSPLTPGSRLLSRRVSADGTFTIPDVAGGPYVLTVAPGQPSWVPLSGVIDGQDSLDRPVEISGNVTGAMLTVTDVATTVQGRVIGMTSGSVVVFSSDSRQWTSGGSRRVKVVAILPGGVFTVSGLPPGTYHAAAFPAGGPIVNAALEEAKGRTIPFELAIGEQKEIVVR